MANPVSGTTTAVTWDSDGAGGSAAVPVAKGSTYEYEEETEVEEQGPFFGEPGIVEVPTGDKYSMKLSLVVPESGDTGQDALLAARKARTRGTLTVDTTKGKKITMTNTLIKKVSIKGEAKGTVTIEIEASATDTTVAAGATGS